MPQALIGAIPAIGSTALGALGLGGQMAGSKQQQKILSQQQQEQQQAFNQLGQLYQQAVSRTPGQEMQQWNQLTGPITANQMLGVSNAVSPALGQMGLGQSAGQLAEAMAPQLAQYQGQNQALAGQMLQNMQQQPIQIGGMMAGIPQYGSGMFPQQGQGGAGSEFLGGLTSLLGKLGVGSGGLMAATPPAPFDYTNNPLMIPPDLGAIGTPAGTISPMQNQPSFAQAIAGGGTGFGV